MAAGFACQTSAWPLWWMSNSWTSNRSFKWWISWCSQNECVVHPITLQCYPVTMALLVIGLPTGKYWPWPQLLILINTPPMTDTHYHATISATCPSVHTCILHPSGWNQSPEECDPRRDLWPLTDSTAWRKCESTVPGSGCFAWEGVWWWSICGPPGELSHTSEEIGRLPSPRPVQPVTNCTSCQWTLLWDRTMVYPLDIALPPAYIQYIQA